MLYTDVIYHLMGFYKTKGCQGALGEIVDYEVMLSNINLRHYNNSINVYHILLLYSNGALMDFTW